MACTIEIPLPGRNAPARVELCGMRWLLERRSNGIFCVAMDETLRFEGWIGLPEEDGLRARLELLAPQHPIELSLASEIVLAPQSVLAGWVPVPLNQRLLVQGSFGELCLVMLEHPDLRIGWREGEGYHHAQRETFRAELEPRGRDRGKLWLRFALDNAASSVDKSVATVIRPKRCRLPLTNCDILSEHGLAIGPRVHWSFGERGRVELEAPSASILAPAFRRAEGSAS